MFDSNKLDAVRVSLLNVRNTFEVLRSVRTFTKERYAAFFDGLKRVSESFELLADMGADVDKFSENWAPLLNAGCFITVLNDSDAVKVDNALYTVAFAMGKDYNGALRAIAARFYEYLGGLCLDVSSAFEATLGAVITKYTAKEARALVDASKKGAADFNATIGAIHEARAEKARKIAEKKAAEKARKEIERAERAAKKGDAFRDKESLKKHRSAAQKELDAVIAAIQAQLGGVMMKDPKTGKYEFTKATA